MFYKIFIFELYIVNMTPGFVAFVVIFTTIVVLIGIFIDISKE